MAMNKGRIKKHNIDMMFLMILFLIFTFSAVSVLLMAINSYKSVVLANEMNGDTRTATAYIREKVRQHDEAGVIDLSEIDGNTAIRIAEGEEYYLYIYYFDGYLMELEAKEGSGATADFGNKILEINGMNIGWKKDSLLQIDIEEADGTNQQVDIGIKSSLNKIEQPQEQQEAQEELEEPEEQEVVIVEE